MELFILFQTDQWKTKSTRICFGVFDREYKAIDAANLLNLKGAISDFDICRIWTNEIEEI